MGIPDNRQCGLTGREEPAKSENHLVNRDLARTPFNLSTLLSARNQSNPMQINHRYRGRKLPQLRVSDA